MKDTFRHYLNPLHIYCRLMDVGVCHFKAQRLCRLYQKVYAVIL